MRGGFGSAHRLRPWRAVRMEDLAPNPAWRQPCCHTGFLNMWGCADVFIPEHKWHSQHWRVHWLRQKFPGLSFTYIIQFSAPFTSSAAIVLKSGLCHVHLKYLMRSRSGEFASTRVNSVVLLTYTAHEWFQRFNINHTQTVSSTHKNNVKAFAQT